MSTQDIRTLVKEKYGQAAVQVTTGGRASCGSTCSGKDPITSDLYQPEETGALPPEALAASLGCGNPTALAQLNPGETVLDLGSGGGIDVLLSAKRVGPTGKAYGLDMTEEMLALARENQRKAGVENVEFLKGEIENIPLPENSVDVVISNCVINLSPQKERVFREAFRVLRTGGRLAVADIVATASLPEEVKGDWAAYTGCMAGATEIDELEKMLGSAGFDRIKVAPKDTSRSFIREWMPGKCIEEYLVSATIEATKPLHS